jgi:hypothetical protein
MHSRRSKLPGNSPDDGYVNARCARPRFADQVPVANCLSAVSRPVRPSPRPGRCGDACRRKSERRRGGILMHEPGIEYLSIPIPHRCQPARAQHDMRKLRRRCHLSTHSVLEKQALRKLRASSSARRLLSSILTLSGRTWCRPFFALEGCGSLLCSYYRRTAGSRLSLGAATHRTLKADGSFEFADSELSHPRRARPSAIVV